MFKKLFLVINIFVILLTYIFYGSNFIKSHPIPLVFNEFIINYGKEKIVLKYRLSIDPTVVNNIYPLIDKNSDNKTSREELIQLWNELIQPNLIAKINDDYLEFQIKDVFLINKTDFRSLNDYLEITLESLFESIEKEINIYFKYDYKFLPEDPYGDAVNFIDNIANNPEIQRLDDIQYYQILNGNEYNAKFKFIENKTTNFYQKESNNTINFNITEIITNFTNYFKNLDFSNPTLTIIGFIILLISGILHALTPGHGKTILSVLLINKKNRNFMDILFLSLSIVISHTGIILLIGTVLYIFNLGYLINNISNLIKDIVAITFIMFGLYLIYRSYKNYKNQNLKKIILGNKNQDIIKFNENTNITRKTIIYSGLLAGLTPCIEALSIFILFLNLGRIDIALLSTLTFSIGLMISIMLIGIIVLKYGNKNMFLNNLENKSQYLVNLISGFIIVLLSVINLVQ